MTAPPPCAHALDGAETMAIAAVTPGSDQLPELLQICEDFFAQFSPAACGELDALLRARGITGGPGWLVDVLAFTRMNLPGRPRTASSGPSEPLETASEATETGRPAR